MLMIARRKGSEEMTSTNLNRRDFFKGVALTGGVAAAGILIGCSEAAPAETKQNETRSEFAQAAPVSYADDYLVDPKTEWEKVCNVPESGLIEGMNFQGDVLWFIDVAKSKIQKVVNGEAVDVYVDGEHNAMPNGAKFIDDHTLLITDRAQGLCTFDINTNEYKVLRSDYNGVKFLGLNDLVLDGQGGAYFTDPGQSDYLSKDGAVYYVNYKEGDFAVEQFATGFAYPNGITISPDGNFLYVAEFNTNSIIVVPSKLYKEAKDTPYVLARLVGGHGPDGVLTDASGIVYGAHLHAGEVVAVDAKGWPVATIRLPENAGVLVSNLTIHDGYLYVCEFSQGNIWRIAINAEPNPIA